MLHPDMTPCISPLPQDGHLQDKSSPSLGLIQEETEVINSIMGNRASYSFIFHLSKLLLQLVVKIISSITVMKNCAHVTGAQMSPMGQDLGLKVVECQPRRKGTMTSVGLSLFVRL